MKRIFKIAFLITAVMVFLASCTKDLNKGPIDPNVLTPDNVYNTPTGIKQVLAKCYAGLSVTGQQGPAGNPDIAGIDEGFGEYIRMFWYHQELPTDEAVISWNDQTVKNFHSLDWTSSDVFVAAMYYRIYYEICLCNEFIRESTDAKLSGYGITNPSDLTNIHHYRAEVRFLRALSYYHALDMFGNVPFVTENDQVGKFFPPQIKRADLFTYIESELKAIEPLIVNAKSNEYGRADKAAVETLLAKLYLNASVYTGTDRSTDCITYCNNVINSGYALDSNYQWLFLADNNLSNEIIFPVEFDGLRTQTYGGTTFILHAAVGGSMVPADYGLAGGWAGTRTTKSFVHLFYPNLKDMPWHSPTPPKNPKSYPILYVPGSYQGWDPSNTYTVLKSVASDNNFEGYLNFPANTQFKFSTTPAWDGNDYGDDGTSTGHLVHPGNNIQVTDAGYYKLNVDMTALTYTIVKTTWSVIGDATPGGWSTDSPMVYDTVGGANVWKVVLDLTVGSLKFRANGAWDINYGDNLGNGVLEAGGSNILVAAAGSYTITMKLGYPDYTYSIVRNSYDHRAMFWTDGQTLDINDIGNFNDGYAVTKWKNVTRSGAPGSNLNYEDIDLPMFRLADVYLMYSEAVLRGGSGGNLSTALTLVNDLRTRAYGDNTGNITSDQLNLQFILDERGRELYWEGYRRTDLVRFGELTTSTYLWPWKGGVSSGVATDAKYNIFPLPAADVSANPNLKQNTGY
jgi:hypothetical protein